MDNGCETSHSVILAKTLEIPTIIGTNKSTDHIVNGDIVIIDSIEGNIIINPDPATIITYIKKKKSFKHLAEKEKKF